MPRLPEPLPTGLGAAFSVSEAAAKGIGRERLRRRDLITPVWGVRTRAGDDVSLISAYASRMPPHAFFSHTTAARIWSLPLPLALVDDARLHVSVPRGRRALAGKAVIGHALSVERQDVCRYRGVSATSLERTILDLARWCTDEDLLALMDSALWHKRDVFARATSGTLSDALARMTTRIDRARTAGLLAMASDRSDSVPESAFRLWFVRAGFPDVEANQPVHGPLGEFIAQPDLVMRRYRLAYDYEGDHHRVSRVQWRKDLQRVIRLQDAGWHHTRLSGDDLAAPAEALARTRRHLIERGWRP